MLALFQRYNQAALAERDNTITDLRRDNTSLKHQNFDLTNEVMLLKVGITARNVALASYHLPAVYRRFDN